MSDSSSLTEENKFLIFRLSFSVLLGSMNLLACFAGKLIKERTITYYIYFHSLCCGILLAKGFSEIFFTKLIRPQVAAFSFSLTFLLLYVAKSLKHHSQYEYNQVSNVDMAMDEDDEDLGIEISDHIPNYLQKDKFENDLEMSRSSSQPKGSLSSMQKLSVIWFFSMAVAVCANELSKGLTLGSETHETFIGYEEVVFDGILHALAFGALCEEALTSSWAFISSVLLFVASKPIGVIFGNFLIYKEIYLSCAWIAVLTAGVYLSFVVFYMIPMDEALNENTLISMRTTKEELTSNARIRMAALIFGYMLTLLTQFL